MNRLFVIITFFAAFSITSCAQKPQQASNMQLQTKDTLPAGAKVEKTDAEWRKELTPEQYYILREHGTERPFTSQYWNKKDAGTYVCGGCGAVLFKSDAKFDAGCGWPSFNIAADNKNILLIKDNSLGMERTEVRCARCNGHLGHLFDDGPPPTGLRFCIDGDALIFKPAK